MEIRDLEYLAASATAGNFARAAEAAGISTSTISRHVARLEDELGLALFERGHSGVRLTSGGRAVLQHVRRVLGELEALKSSGSVSGAGDVGEIRLGVRLPPIGTQLVSLLAGWRARNPNVTLTVAELSDRDLVSEVEERRLDVVLTASQALWPRVASVPLFRDRLMAVLPVVHPLVRRSVVRWAELREEVVLVQGWDESQVAREFYAAFLGEGARFQAHPASKQSVFALVSAGFGITFATASHAETGFAGVVFKRIDVRAPPWKCHWRGSLSLRTPSSGASWPSFGTRPAREVCPGTTDPRRSLAKARSVTMKRTSIGAISFAGSTAPCPGSPSARAPGHRQRDPGERSREARS